MARRRSSVSRKSISKAAEDLSKTTSENEAEKKLSAERDTEEDEHSEKLGTDNVQASVLSPESGVNSLEGDEGIETNLSQTSVSNRKSLLDEQGRDKANEMARAYGKYSQDNIKDTPKHLYGFDGALMSSDEEVDIDIQGLAKENSATNLFDKLKHYVKGYWKQAAQGISLFIISGIVLAFLLQGYSTWPVSNIPVNDPHSDTLRKIEEKVDQLSSVLQIIANITDSSSDSKSSISEESVQQIVQAALERYNADKVGMADFALESSGAEIHDSYHSASYDVGSARVVLFGIPMWFDIKPPRVILQPDNSPGNCWAFKGDKGYVVIKLSKTVTPTAFSIEHIPKLLSPTGDGRIPSAPKEFTVWGWKDPLGNEKVKLGYYIYDSEGDFLQTFNVQLHDGTEVVQYIELRILSNHGNSEYTCVYRFRVHGNPH